MTRPSGARWSSPGIVSAIHVAVGRPRRPRRAGSTPSRPARRAGTSRRLRRMTSRRHVPRTRVGLGRRRARRRHVHRVVAEVGQVEVAQELAAVRDAGSRSSAACPAGAQRGELGDAARPSSSNSSSGPVAAHPRLEQRAVSGVRPDLAHRDLVRAPGALDLAAVDLLRARSSPWASGARSSASAAARSRPSSRAARWISRISSSHGVERRRQLLVDIAPDRRPRRSTAGTRSPPSASRARRVGIRARTVGLAIL